MKQRNVWTVFLFVFLSVGGFLLLSRFSSFELPARAYETQCPDYMTDEECLVFLQEQARLIEQDKGALEGSINAENYEQMSLSQQIAYLASLVEQTELQIAEKEVDIETKNVEINLLGKDIVKAQNAIDTLTQEINVLETTMKKRTKSSYKMTFMSPMEIVLDSNDFTSLLRRMKYLVEAKKQDRKLLIDMSISKEQLAEEQVLLEEKRVEVQSKRNEVESQRAELAEARSNLDDQRAQQQVLLAESQRREAALLAQLNATRESESALDGQISEIITRMIEEGSIPSQGHVSKGTIIGQMGSTGCSTGAHLHFSINNNPNAVCQSGGWTIKGIFCGTLSPWSGYLSKGPDWWSQYGGWTYYYIRSGSFQVPLAGSVVLTQDHHQGTAIDLVSLDGEGAPVYAAMGGELRRGVESICGGKFAIINHSDGSTTVYLHLK